VPRALRPNEREVLLVKLAVMRMLSAVERFPAGGSVGSRRKWILTRTLACRVRNEDEACCGASGTYFFS